MDLSCDIVDDVPLSILKYLDDAWAEIVNGSGCRPSDNGDDAPLTVVFSSVREGEQIGGLEPDYDSVQAPTCEESPSASPSTAHLPDESLSAESNSPSSIEPDNDSFQAPDGQEVPPANPPAPFHLGQPPSDAPTDEANRPSASDKRASIAEACGDERPAKRARCDEDSD